MIQLYILLLILGCILLEITLFHLSVTLLGRCWYCNKRGNFLGIHPSKNDLMGYLVGCFPTCFKCYRSAVHSMARDPFVEPKKLKKAARILKSYMRRHSEQLLEE